MSKPVVIRTLDDAKQQLFRQTTTRRSVMSRPHIGTSPSECNAHQGQKCHSTPVARVTRFLLIDSDTELMPAMLHRAFPEAAQQIQAASTAAEGLRLIRMSPPDVIVLESRLPDQCCLELHQAIRQIDARIPVIFVTMERGAELAINAIRQGAYDYLFKPVDVKLLRQVVGEALRISALMRESISPTDSPPQLDSEGIIGACPSMREIYKAIGRVAAQNVPVLITGESGTGKELIARAIYQHGWRAKAPFQALNCAAIPDQLLESELLGHEKGAFTGADRQRNGRFKQCDGGTLFLDEIGDMSLTSQAKILRLIQEQAFERVGGHETVRTDVRLIAATHRDLKTLSAEGKFRLDLYYRLGVFTIHVPPLRERGDDLPMLVDHFLRRYSRLMGRDTQQASPEALQQLSAYHWPGNVRELQSVIKQSLLRARGRILLPEFLPELSQLHQSKPVEPPLTHHRDLDAFIEQRLNSSAQEMYAETHAYVDRLLLKRVVEYSDGNQHRAARLLGIARQTLRLKLRELNMRITQSLTIRSSPRST